MSEKWPRRVLTQVEIIEDRENCPFVRLLFDQQYYAAVSIADTGTISAANEVLWKVLHQVLDKYQPRLTIESSIESKQIEREGEE
jgi:hypothetical protein